MTYGLAMMLADTNKGRAAELYERTIADGEKKSSPNNLTNLIKEEDPERADSLFEMAIQAGDNYYATRNLALLIRGRDSEYAVELFTKTVKVGNKSNLYYDLEPLMREGLKSAIELCEQKVISQNASFANNIETSPLFFRKKYIFFKKLLRAF